MLALLGLLGAFPPSAIGVVASGEHADQLVVQTQQESTEDLPAREAVIAAEIARTVEFISNSGVWEQLADGLAAGGSLSPEELEDLSLPNYLVDVLRELRQLLLTFADPCEPDGAGQWVTDWMAQGNALDEALSMSLALCDLMTAVQRIGDL